MFLLSLWQQGEEITLAIFESLETGREFVRKIPGYCAREIGEKEQGYFEEIIVPNDFPDYVEIEHCANLFPMTRFMFPSLSEEIAIIWRELPNMDMPKQNIAQGSTRGDAYIVGNDELKSYIFRREENYARIKGYMERNGYEVSREFVGSEDGEAITYRCQGSEIWHFLVHLDASFVENVPSDESALKEWLEGILVTT